MRDQNSIPCLRRYVPKRGTIRPNLGEQILYLEGTYSMFIPSIYYVLVTSIQISCSDIYLSPLQSDSDLKGGSGAVSLDLDLLKQYRGSPVATNAIKRSGAPDRVWLETRVCILQAPPGPSVPAHQAR